MSLFKYYVNVTKPYAYTNTIQQINYSAALRKEQHRCSEKDNHSLTQAHKSIGHTPQRGICNKEMTIQNGVKK